VNHGAGRTADQHSDPRRQPGLHDASARRARKAQVLTRHSASGVGSIADAIVIKEHEPFFLCPSDGQIPLSGDHGFGLYHHDTRFLSGYELTIAGKVGQSLAATSVAGGRGIIELTTPELRLGGGRSLGKERLAIRWTRTLDSGAPRLLDHIRIRNYDEDPVRLPIRLRFGSGFEDIFEVRGLLDERPGTLHEPAWDGDRLVLRYDGRDGVDRSLAISFDRQIERRDGTTCELAIEVGGRDAASFEVRLEIGEHLRRGAAPIERRTAELDTEDGARHRRETTVAPSRAAVAPSRAAGARPRAAGARPRAAGDGWPVSITTDSIALEAVLASSLDDLLTLRGELDGQRYYAAGVPWFSTLFGRDSLISAYQTLAFDSRIAAETLRLLAGRQGSHDDDFRDEQPGKILHELRIGELARLGEIPQTPYFGSIDATPLFLVLLAREADWTGSLDLFRELRSNVDRALAWIDGPADAAGNGYVSYTSDVDHGLVNQGWKDSGNAIATAAGDPAKPPIALAEVQGYVHAAKVGIAALFERDGDLDRAQRLRAEAEDLRQRFERDFWSDELGCYRLALEAGGRGCDVVASNAGQVLWTGIAAADRADATARRLLADDCFDGWGIRTLSSEAIAFNPIGYHLGTVWPHDNGLIAEGFRRYGLDEEAERLFVALIEAATDFPQHRLPECFAGYARTDFGVPVRYPIACHPQAWAAGATPHLLTSMLGLVPEAFERRLRVVRPRLPPFVGHLAISGVRVGEATVDLAFEYGDDDRTVARVTHVDGELDVRIEASGPTGQGAR
jgi:glycogen debranching enzyme